MNTDGELDRDFIARSIRRGIIIAVATVVALALLWLLKSALTPLAVAFVFAYLLDPLIDQFEARRIPRRVAILFLVAISGVLALVTAIFLVPKLLQEIAHLAVKAAGLPRRRTRGDQPPVRIVVRNHHTELDSRGYGIPQSSGVSVPLESLRRADRASVRSMASPERLAR